MVSIYQHSAIKASLYGLESTAAVLVDLVFVLFNVSEPHLTSSVERIGAAVRVKLELTPFTSATPVALVLSLIHI